LPPGPFWLAVLRLAALRPEVVFRGVVFRAVPLLREVPLLERPAERLRDAAPLEDAALVLDPEPFDDPLLRCPPRDACLLATSPPRSNRERA
jgi:hypothetical protein